MTPISELRRLLGLQGELPALVPRFNIAPTQPLPIIRTPHRLELLRWGLPTRVRPMINVRAECGRARAAVPRLFRRGAAWWSSTASTSGSALGKRKQPFYVSRRWQAVRARRYLVPAKACGDRDARPLPASSKLHDRMPVLLAPNASDRWLAADADPRQLTALMAPNAEGLRAYAVSTLVNNPAHDDPGCIEPQADGALGENLELF